MNIELIILLIIFIPVGIAVLAGIGCLIYSIPEQIRLGRAIDEARENIIRRQRESIEVIK